VKDERILRDLQRLVREKSANLDAKWEALVTGEASPEEESALRALAEQSPEARVAYEALRPIDEATLDQMSQTVLRALEAKEGHALEASTRIYVGGFRLPHNAPVSKPSAPEAGGLGLGAYRWSHELAMGSTSVVWAAQHVASGREVAIKLFTSPEVDSGRGERLFQRMRAYAGLARRHLTQLFDFGVTPEGQVYLVMERLKGRTLRDLLQQRGRLEPALAARIAQEAAAALAGLHGAKLLHRDLKPARVFLHQEEDAPEGIFVVKLLPSLYVPGQYKEPAQTPVGGSMGTPLYTSPEALRSPDQVDDGADIWALGVTLYEMLTGEKPFAPGSPMDAIAKILNTPSLSAAAKVPGLSREIDAIVQRATAHRREDRYANAGALEHALRIATRQEVVNAARAAISNEPPGEVGKMGTIIMPEAPPPRAPTQSPRYPAGTSLPLAARLSRTLKMSQTMPLRAGELSRSISDRSGTTSEVAALAKPLEETQTDIPAGLPEPPRRPRSLGLVVGLVTLAAVIVPLVYVAVNGLPFGVGGAASKGLTTPFASYSIKLPPDPGTVDLKPREAPTNAKDGGTGVDGGPATQMVLPPSNRAPSGLLPAQSTPKALKEF